MGKPPIVVFINIVLSLVGLILAIRGATSQRPIITLVGVGVCLIAVISSFLFTARAIKKEQHKGG